MIRSFVDGVQIADEEVKQQWIYFACAKEFGWTKKETDEHDFPFLTNMLEFQENIMRKQNEAMK